MQTNQAQSDGPIAKTIVELSEIFGDRLSTSMAMREQHGHDESYHATAAPDAVIFPHSTEEVSEAVKICAKHKTPIIPYGAGTSLEGAVAAIRGGICFDLGQMGEILEINAEDLDCRVQAGVRRKYLNETLRDTGLFFPIDPGADATIGGMASTRASGTNAVRYGTMRENVLSLTAVMADGRIVRSARRSKKSAAGYDLTRLLVGAEGTLAIITEVAVKLYGIPEAVSAAVCQFPTTEDAVNTCILTIQSGVPVARVELLDEVGMKACIDHSNLEGYDEKPTLFFEFSGSEAGVKEQAEIVEGISEEFSATGFKWATRPEDRSKLWEARHQMHYASKAMRPGAEVMAADVCVPISRLAECISECKKDLEESGLVGPIVGHVGDGNFHVGYVIDPNNADEVKAAHDHNDRMVLRAIAMDGTCTGEHGVGQGKIRFMNAEHGEAVAVMRTLKQALDPDNIMNPGKILPAN